MLSNRYCEPAKKKMDQASKPCLRGKKMWPPTESAPYFPQVSLKVKKLPPSIAQKLASVKEKCNCTTFTEDVRLFFMLANAQR